MPLKATMYQEMEKEEPLKLIVEYLDDVHARITLTDPETVEVVVEDGEAIGYRSNKFAVECPYRAGLHESVSANFDAWLDIAKLNASAQMAERIRKKRNEFLRQTDARLALDRLGLDTPTGSTFTAFLSLLKGIVSALTGDWAQYRQQLRDLPNHPDFPYLKAEDWPTPPEDIQDD